MEHPVRQLVDAAVSKIDPVLLHNSFKKDQD